MGKGLGEGVRIIYRVRVVCGVIRYLFVSYYLFIDVQVNLDMTDSMGPRKIGPSYAKSVVYI